MLWWLLFMAGHYCSGFWVGKLNLKALLFILMVGRYFCIVKLYHANAIAVIPARFMIFS